MAVRPHGFLHQSETWQHRLSNFTQGETSSKRTLVGECCYCLWRLPIAAASCYCSSLSTSAVAHFFALCFCPMTIAVANCCCLLLLPIPTVRLYCPLLLLTALSKCSCLVVLPIDEITLPKVGPGATNSPNLASASQGNIDCSAEVRTVVPICYHRSAFD